MNLTDLDTFLRVVETGSFTKAAVALDVPKSTVSRRVARLEEQLGLELLKRKARSFTVTPHGQQLHARCAPALREIEAVERGLGDATSDPTGLLRVTASPDLGVSPAFSQLLVSFRQAYPHVAVQLELTMRSVDLVEEGFDVAFRFHAQQMPDSTTLMRRRLSKTGAGVYASPDYLDARGRPQGPDALPAHDLVTLDRPFLRHSWGVRREGEAMSELPIEPRMIVSDFAVLAQLLAAGAGIGILPEFLAEHGLRTGRLERVLPDWSNEAGQLSLVWPSSRFLAPRVRAFIDHVAEHGVGESACGDEEDD